LAKLFPNKSLLYSIVLSSSLLLFSCTKNIKQSLCKTLEEDKYKIENFSPKPNFSDNYTFEIDWCFEEGSLENDKVVKYEIEYEDWTFEEIEIDYSKGSYQEITKWNKKIKFIKAINNWREFLFKPEKIINWILGVKYIPLT